MLDSSSRSATKNQGSPQSLHESIGTTPLTYIQVHQEAKANCLSLWIFPWLRLQSPWIHICDTLSHRKEHGWRALWWRCSESSTIGSYKARAWLNLLVDSQPSEFEICPLGMALSAYRIFSIYWRWFRFKRHTRGEELSWWWGLCCWLHQTTWFHRCYHYHQSSDEVILYHWCWHWRLLFSSQCWLMPC